MLVPYTIMFLRSKFKSKQWSKFKSKLDFFDLWLQELSDLWQFTFLTCGSYCLTCG